MITIHCLVDNQSSDPARFQAEHGVAFVIEPPSGKVLFDTGQSGSALLHNAAQMNIDLHAIDALALSHAHDDHTGGLKSFLQHSQPGLPVYAHPDLFRQRYSAKDGVPRARGLPVTQSQLAGRATLRLSAEPAEILPGVWTTGEICQRDEFEGRSAHHYIRAGEDWLPDPYRDDMSLALETLSGVILVCGCCHAGLLNTLAHVKRLFCREIVAIIGGAHLGEIDTKTLEHTIAVLRAINPNHLPELHLNHCTGGRALAALAQAFGEKAHSCPAGTTLIFE